jgi:hypothetical protein
MDMNSVNITITFSDNTEIDEHGSKLLPSMEKPYLDNFTGGQGEQFRNKIAMSTRPSNGQWRVALSVQD